MPVFWNTVGKVEVIPTDNIKAGKIRIFQVPPMEFVFTQKKFTLRLSERFKGLGWSAYGFNPYRGGMHNLATSLLKKRHRICYDVSGWDKFICFIRTVYTNQAHLQDIPIEDREEFSWMVQNLTNIYLRLPNGKVILKDLGNPSGSGSTTLDNIRCHIILLLVLMYWAYFEKNGRKPTIHEIDNQFASIFGDDNIIGVDEEFDLLGDFDWMSKKMSLFCLKLKFLVHTQNDLDGLSFLGAHFVKRDGVYIPRFDVQRLSYSMVYDLKPLKLVPYISKIFSLFLMSFGNSEHYLFRNALDTFFNSTLVRGCRNDSVQGYLDVYRYLNENALMDFYSGTESSLSLMSFLDFFEDDSDDLESVEGGFKRMQNALLDKLVENKQIEPSSRAFLKAAIDPWHDTAITDLRGVPDLKTGSSVVFDVVREISISKSTGPTALPAGPWQFRVAVLPITSNTNMKASTLYGGLIEFPVGTSTAGISNILVSYGTNGADFSNVGDNATNPGGQFLEIPSDFLGGQMNLIGLGVELINTTPELVASGLISCLKVPQPEDNSRFTAALASTAGLSCPGAELQPVRCPPVNLTEATLYSNLTQWHAKEGAYCVTPVKFSRTNGYPTPSAPVYITDDFTSGKNYYVTPMPCYIPSLTQGTIGGVNYNFIPRASSFLNIDSPVIMATGLSDQTEMTLRCRWIFEKFPSEDEPTQLRLARPCATYDPNALEIYSRAMAMLPPGVMYKMNPAGEFWKLALGKIAKAAAPLLAFIPHPVAKAASIAAAGAGELLENSAAESKVKRKRNNSAGKYGEGKKKNKRGEIVVTQPKKQAGRSLPKPSAAPKV